MRITSIIQSFVLRDFSGKLVLHVSFQTKVFENIVSNFRSLLRI